MVDLTGKWVLFQSNWVGGVLDVKPHLVTQHSKNRIHISELCSVWDVKKKEYVFVEDTEGVGYKLASSVRLVFDSREAAVESAYYARAEYDKWFRDQKLEMGRKVLELASKLGGKRLSELGN